MREINPKNAFLFGFLFGGIISFLFSLVLVIIDIIIYKRVGSALCIEIGFEGAKTFCSFSDALLSKIILFFAMFTIFGIILGFLGFAIGYLVKKISLE